MAGSGAAGLAGFDPFPVMADRGRNRRGGPLEIGKLRFGQQQVFAVVGQQHTLLADEQLAYAARDVFHLQDLLEVLEAEIDKSTEIGDRRDPPLEDLAAAHRLAQTFDFLVTLALQDRSTRLR